MRKIQITDQTEIFRDKYIILKKADYQSGAHQGNWTYLERTNNTKASVIIPLLPKTNEIILIKQFRIPLNNYIIEFPAGLIDEGESPTDAALRELKEETGYNATLKACSPALATSAGLCSEEIYLVEVEVSGEPELQKLEAAEDIEVLKLPLNDALNMLEKLVEANNYRIDSKVYSYLKAIS